MYWIGMVEPVVISMSVRHSDITVRTSALTRQEATDVSVRMDSEFRDVCA